MPLLVVVDDDDVGFFVVDLLPDRVDGSYAAFIVVQRHHNDLIIYE